jgi:hypothetical protein
MVSGLCELIVANGGPGQPTGGRVFLSHTTELASWPPTRSCVQAALDAIGAVDLQGLDMRHFAFEASMHPGLTAKPTNFESAAGCAVSRTTVATSKNALHAPEPLPLAIMQSIPAGCEVTRRAPLPPGKTDTLPCEKWNGSHAVMIACRSVLKSPPTVPMITADWALVTWLVVTGNVALVAAAGTVTLGGTVAAAVLSLVRSTTKPPAGAAADSVTLPVAESPPITSVGLTVSAVRVGAVGGGGWDTVQPVSVRDADVRLSDTVTTQSAGAAKFELSMRNRPPPSRCWRRRRHHAVLHSSAGGRLPGGCCGCCGGWLARLRCGGYRLDRTPHRLGFEKICQHRLGSCPL